MKKRYLFIGILTMLFAILLLFIESIEKDLNSSNNICYISVNDQDIIYPFEYEKNKFYVFLPSYANLNQIKFHSNTDAVFNIDNRIISSGMTLNNIETGKDYDFVFNKKRGCIRFLKSANVSTLYMSTARENIGLIDKYNNEEVSFTLYNQEGILDFQDNTAKIKGRGKSTWDLSKKPYTVTLTQSSELLGMENSQKWVLLANGYDETNLRNKLCLDLAEQLGFYWTPKSEYVDVYIDGNYNGLYLLTEKIQADSQRLNINCNTGDFLCKIELNNRQSLLNNCFTTKNGRLVEICEPQTVSDAQKDRIISLVNQMEDIILSGQIDDQSMIDIESWAKRYLIDEISANVDSDVASSYFYYKDNRFYAGPIWDYDLTFGNSLRNLSSNSLVANNYFMTSERIPLYYGYFYDNKTFNEYLKNTYQNNVLPILNKMIDENITSRHEAIKDATQLNSLRWNNMFKTTYQNGIYFTTADDIILYLKHRVDFLNDIWINDSKYHTLRFEVKEKAGYCNISVPHNTPLNIENIPFIDFSNTKWVHEDTKKVFDPKLPIKENLILTKHRNNRTAFLKEIPIRYYIDFMLIGLIVILYIILVIVDKKTTTLERRRKDGNKISS